ncbi:MAG: TraR/DksA family transcriptional regulator, partial [Actinomycetia bacterium]|nr:TraR/DksA family transcriptional regulator [Actinomycetes bacterium]
APPRRNATNSQLARSLAVLENESRWTAAEIGEVRGDLESEQTRLRGEIERAEADLRALLREGVDGAGNDQADVGSNSLERDAEMSLAHSHRELLRQVEHALGRIYEGTYGSCESCGNPIGKMRLMAFPRATLCITCKQREERR